GPAGEFLPPRRRRAVPFRGSGLRRRRPRRGADRDGTGWTPRGGEDRRGGGPGPGPGRSHFGGLGDARLRVRGGTGRRSAAPLTNRTRDRAAGDGAGRPGGRVP